MTRTPVDRSAADRSGMITRRTAIAAGVLGGAAACATPASGPSAASAAASGSAPNVFAHGVASGDPLADRVILWTRVTAPPELRRGLDGGFDVVWQVYEAGAPGAEPGGEPGVVAAEGVARATADRDDTVKVDVGGLEAGRAYAYRFFLGDLASPLGRTRTLPVGAVETFRLATLSCANHPAGWFHIYRHVADRGDLDLVLFLGDYLYEYGPGGYATGWGERRGRTPDPPHEIVTLDDYRRRHAQYKSDPDLQAAHAAAPWICIWDDHESTNNAYVEGAQNHQPDTEGDWAMRKAAAIRAYLEWMPIRAPEAGEPGLLAALANRTFEIGDLATLVMLESRLLARAPEITWGQAPVPPTADPKDPDNRAAIAAFLRDVVGDPNRTMIGPDQLGALEAAFAASRAAGKPWQILGNAVPMARLKAPDYTRTLPWWLRAAIKRVYPEAYEQIRYTAYGIPQSLDTWDGFPAERERLYAAVRRADARLLTLTGDTHCAYANRLVDNAGVPVGAELICSSVTSPSEYNLGAAPGVDYGALNRAANAEVIVHHNAVERGYLVVDLTPDAAQASFIAFDTVKTSRLDDRPDSRIDARLRLTPGAAGGVDLTPI